MSNTIRIEPAALLLVRGEVLRVPIRLTLVQPLKVRGIHARFHGAEETKAVYTTTTTDSKGHMTTQTHTAVEQVDIVRQDYLLFGQPKLGFFGNLQDAAATLLGGGKHELLQAGNYEYTVDISIPANAPPTHTGEKTRVFYELSAQVDIPLGWDLKATQSFDLGPLENGGADIQPVRARYPDDAGRGFFDSIAAPDVKVEMALAADRYCVGDTIDGIVVVETAKPVQCRALRVRLTGTEHSQASGHSDSYTHQGPAIEVAQPGLVEKSYKQEFSVVAQAAGPPTARGQRFSIDWFVEVEFDVPWAKNPKIRAPITLLPAPRSPAGAV